MTAIKKATVSDSSIGVDVKQPLTKKHNEIITDSLERFNVKEADNVTSNMTEVRENELQTISMEELYETVYPPRVPIVDGLIFNGTYLFVGAPKVGKSFFMAQLGYYVSMGIPLWGFPVTKGTVLYLVLEDDNARLQRRLSKMFGMEASRKLHFATQSKSLNEGLEEQLHSFVSKHSDARLIIIDTLQKVREASGDKLSYGSDYEIVTKLKKFSDQYGICLLVVHHTRKMESSDSFDMISGTNGLLGAADGAFIMQKEKRTENRAVLEIAGRDQQDQRLLLNFNREQCVWELTKTETELWKEPVDAVLEALATIVTIQKPEWSGSASELLQLLPEINMQPNVLTRKLNVSLERLFVDYHIKYESIREHSGRKIKLSLMETEA